MLLSAKEMGSMWEILKLIGLFAVIYAVCKGGFGILFDIIFRNRK